MNIPSWGIIFRALQKAVDDRKANAPRPIAPPATSAELHADIERVEALAPVAKAWLAAHPGELTAADDILDMLEVSGFAWAAGLRSGLDAAPELVDEAIKWLPALNFVFGGVFQAAPTGIPGGLSGARGHV